MKCGSSPRSTGNVCLPASLEDLRSELPDDILLHAIASHPEAHERLGEQLIERPGGPRPGALTEAGRLLAERAEEILGRLDAAEAELAAHVGLSQEKVRLAAFGSALGTLAAAAGSTLRAERSGTDISLAQAEPADALRMLRIGEADVALIFSYVHEPVLHGPGHVGLREGPTGPRGGFTGEENGVGTHQETRRPVPPPKHNRSFLFGRPTPAAPLPRLSSAETIISRPVGSSSASAP